MESLMAQTCTDGAQEHLKAGHRVTFKGSIECRLFAREQAFDTTPADGGVALGLGSLVSTAVEPLNQSFDHDINACKRFPSRHVQDRLLSLPAAQRDVSTPAPVSTCF